MASADQSAPVNGNHAAHQQYGEQTYAHTTSDYGAAAAPPATAVSNGEADIPKDEVGWFFVEQYYTILSKNPERLYLFYNKRSQFVSGNEAEKVMTCVGPKPINDRIKELDFQDAKVRVTNVDSQGSGQCIVIQVIGEISNKSQPQRKFVQTFVLAEQTNGYFVLNDIFRYIDDDGDDEQEEPPVGAAGEEEQQQQIAASGYQEAQPPAVLPSDGNASALEAAAATVDSKLEHADPAAPNGTESVADQLVHAQEAPVAAPATVEETAAVQPEQLAEAVAQETVAEGEKPKDPEPTPAASPLKKPAELAKPAVPKTWAGLVAANSRVAMPSSGATPSSAAPAAATPSPPSQAKPRPSVQTAAAPVAAATAAAATPPASTTAQDPEQPGTPASSGSEWQTAARDHGKKQARVQAQAVPVPEAEKHRGYIKNVSETVDAEALRVALAKVAQVTYFDVNRQKNCAFVDFASPAGCQAAIAANPHVINGENIYVEERRVKNPNFAGPGRGGYIHRGGRGDGRPQGQGRGGFQRDGGRGGFIPRGRGGGPGARGARGGAPAAV